MNNKKGFTLVEIIFSIAFLSVISVVILKLFVVSYEIDKKTELIDIATLQAVNDIENVKSFNEFKDVKLEKYFNETWESISSSENSVYSIVLDVSKNDLYDRGLYDIEVIVLDNLLDEEIIHIETIHYSNFKE